jgi:hypothetical protein
MIELFSAVLLICSMTEGGKTICKTVVYPGAFSNHVECIKYLVNTEKKNGREWAEKEEYVVSSACIDWKFKTQKI